MTEVRLAVHFEGLKAFRDATVNRAGELTVLAGIARGAGLDDLAHEIDRHAFELAAGLEVLTRIADEAMDDTHTMSLGDIAEG